LSISGSGQHHAVSLAKNGLHARRASGKLLRPMPADYGAPGTKETNAHMNWQAAVGFEPTNNGFARLYMFLLTSFISRGYNLFLLFLLFFLLFWILPQ
jgi:hypothetical protein